MIYDAKKANKIHFALIDSADYFKAIEIIVNDKGLIVGLVFISLKGITAKAGVFEGTRRPLSIDRNEHPCCIYGTFN